jgi:protein SCO1
MKSSVSVLLAALVLTLPQIAHAHEDHAQHQAAAADHATPAEAKPLKAKRDPRAYFTDTELLTQDGKKVRFYSDVLKGRVVVLSTMYTSCEEACPLITEQLKKISENLGPQFGKEIFFIAITNDAGRDNPQALKKYATKHKTLGPGWTYLTGKKTDVDAILKKLGAWSEHIESHTTQLIVWNFNTDRGRKMAANMPPEAVAQQISFVASADGLPLPAGIPSAAAAAAAAAAAGKAN